MVQLMRRLRSRRALRVRLLDPAQGRRQGARRAAAACREDVTDLHAWAEVFLPGAGWIGFDATSGLLCAEGHMPLACTADPTSAAPVTGSFVPVAAARRATTVEHRVRGRDEGRAHARAPARHQALHRGGLGGHRSAWARKVDAALVGERRAPVDGRRADVRLDRRSRRRRVEHGGARPAPSAGWPASCSTACTARFAPGRPAALRPGQVVPGRAAAALGDDLLLPQGRRADLAPPRAGRARAERRPAPRRERTRRAR